MKKFFALLLALCLMLGCTCASASTFDALQQMLRGGDQTETTQTTEKVPQGNSIGGGKEAGNNKPAAPASNVTARCLDGLTVVSSNMVPATSEYSSYIYSYVYIEVRNDGTSTVEVDGDIAVVDKNGKTLESQRYLNCYPKVIAPGETAFVIDYLMVSKDSAGGIENVATAMVNLQADSYNRNPEPVHFLESQSANGKIKDKNGTEHNVGMITLGNSGDGLLMNPCGVCGLYDEQGNLVVAVRGELGSYSNMVLLHPGSSVTISCKIDEDVMAALAEKGVTIKSSKGLAYFE